VIVLRNTLLWVVITPILATAIGLVYAVLVDRTRFEAFAKALIFLPMAISFVGAAIIWKFVYAYRPNQQNIQQIGLLNQFLVWLGLEPVNFILQQPWNNLLLIVVMIWIQAGFAMTVLSAAIKAIPSDIVEAARLDGVGGFRLFWYITLPSIRPAVVVVVTAISIAVLKVFDIVRTMTGGQFGTSVIANEFYAQSFRISDLGMGSALAMVLFVLVVPIVIYNVRQMRKAEAR
jgi:alpha-glucoside transport system permease protein